MNALLILGFALGATTSPPAGATLVLTVDTETDTYLTTSHCEESALASSASFAVSTDSLTPIIAENDKLYIWWETSDSGECTTPSAEESNQVVQGAVLNGELISQDGGTPLVSSSMGLNFPEGVSSATLTYQEIFARIDTDACTTDVDYTELTLCVAIDSVASTLDNDVTISSTAEAWTAVNFVIDTAAPSAPTVDSITALDGAVDIKVSVSDENPQLATWKLYIQEQGAVKSIDCSDWDVEATEYSPTATSSETLNYRVNNGLVYEFCVVAVDEAGNESEASEVTVAQSQDECDFIECYPGDLKDGHCSAAPPALWWLAGLGILWRRRRGGLNR
jgi:MYXO-CTERM domain-containing protein